MRLLIMRHAKSSWRSGAEDDHARPLNQRGRRDAPRMGAALVERGWVPERVLCSTAQRTRETWELLAPSFPDAEVSFHPALYLAGVGAIQEACQPLADDVGTVLVLGHNPGWEQAAAWLAGDDVSMTTANVALLEHDDEPWYDALHDASGWTLHALLRPKES